MSEREPGTCTILVIGRGENDPFYDENIAGELNYSRMKFSRIPTKGEFIRFKSRYFEVKDVYWYPKYGTEAMIEVVSSGAD
jgi:hypothetical protein